MLRVGLISDTHGLLRQEAKAFLVGCDHIVHCGDVGAASIIVDLAVLAPLTVVRGNNDKGTWAESLPDSDMVQLGSAFVYVLHDLAQIDIEPSAAGIHAVVFGHSHKPSVRTENGVLFVNPGSAGPRRFRLPIAVGELVIEGTSVSARIIEF